MIVVDLFSGLGGWSAAAREDGDRVTRVEREARFEAEIHADILTLDAADLPSRPDLLLASPPCEGFSVMRIGRNWTRDGQPKTETARIGLALVEKTLQIIEELKPRYWVMENPVGKLRVLPVVAGLERRTVTYCQYGERRMKPTDLWSAAWPPSLDLRPMCRQGAPCHQAAPRGSRTGTQGYGDYWTRSLVPEQLSRQVTDAARRDLRDGATGRTLSLWGFG